MGPDRLQDQRIRSQDGKDDAKKGQTRKWSKTEWKTRVFAGSEAHEKGQVDPKRGPRWAKIGPRWLKMGPSWPKMGQDGRKMAQDSADDLQDAAQDRQDAISEGCFEDLMKKIQLRVRRGSVKGPARRDARPCSRLRLSGVCRIGQSRAVI